MPMIVIGHRLPWANTRLYDKIADVEPRDRYVRVEIVLRCHLLDTGLPWEDADRLAVGDA